MSIQEQEAKDALEVQRALDEILSRDRSEEEPLLGKLWDAFVDLFPDQNPFAGTALGWWSQLQGVVMLLAIGALCYLIIRFVVLKYRDQFGATQEAAQAGIPVAQRVAALRRAALEARLAGDWRLSLQKQFFALVLGLGERGDLEFRDAWTNRELLALGSPSRQVQAILGPLLLELEPKEFGRMAVQEEDLNRLESLSLDYFGALEAAH